jgi:UPF0288 family protein (methanogenesis marker protein 3)
LFFILSQQLIDKIVAVVNDKPITLSEVNLMKAFQENISFEEALQKTIILNLKYEDSLKYISPSVSKEEKEKFLKQLNLKESPLNLELVSKFIIIKKYVEIIIDPTIYVTEEEIQRYIEKNNLKIDENTKEYEDLKKLIFLKKENENLFQWEEKLKKEAKIKILN